MNVKDSNWFLYTSVFSVNLMSFATSIAFSWTSPFLPKLKGEVDPENNPLTDSITLLEESWITTFMSVGSLCGPFVTGHISEKIGKKLTLVIFSIPMFLSYLILVFANTVIHFYISRFLAGLGVGCAFCVIPPYVAEISNVTNRGKTGIFMAVMSSLGHVFVVTIGPYVTIKTFGIISLTPCILFLIIFLPFIPDSPYYYVSCQRIEDAKSALKKFRQKQDVELELQKIVSSVQHTKVEGNLKKILKSKVVLKGLLISVGLMLSQQIVGSQPINAYQQEVFHSSSTIIPSEISVIIVGIAQFLATAVAVAVVDTFGRKKLLLTSYFGIFISLVTLGTYSVLKNYNFNVDRFFWLPVTSTCLFMMCFRFGAGPVSWSIVGEIFPSNLKNYLTPVVTLSMVVFGFVVTFIFPFSFAYLGMAWTMWIYAFCTVGVLMFIWFKVPEIKGKSFEEIQSILQK